MSLPLLPSHPVCALLEADHDEVEALPSIWQPRGEVLEGAVADVEAGFMLDRSIDRRVRTGKCNKTGEVDPRVAADKEAWTVEARASGEWMIRKRKAASQGRGGWMDSLQDVWRPHACPLPQGAEHSGEVRTKRAQGKMREPQT